MEQYLDEVVELTKKIEKKKRYAIESLMAHSDWNKTIMWTKADSFALFIY